MTRTAIRDTKAGTSRLNTRLQKSALGEAYVQTINAGNG